MILETVCVGPMQVNCYILASRKNSSAIIIDPGDEERKIRQVLDKHKLKPAFIINTHGHYDHIGCDDKFGVPVYIHRQDSTFLKDPQLNMSGLFALPHRIINPCLPNGTAGASVSASKTTIWRSFSWARINKSEIRVLKDRDTIELDDIELEVLHMPGHTPGGIALLMKKPTNKIVFTGDSLFCQGIGRTDFVGGDQNLLIKSIKEKLLTLADDTVIYPGHGPSSTIGEEKRITQ